ncbi:hypothetical protein WR25_11627 [Diploscapter pachys]|uniref:Uncharacterized protein n=1 Tax=Diploscapter pachys TaxID=2018661 RepID=A0A2A2KRA8_9BILA|nr:hypothetical protein WR25_11627 [Diploscapter pachys]
MFKYFYEEGKLYQNNIVVCQINIEIHEPLNDDMKQQTHNFLVRLAKEGRYAVFRPAKLYQLLRIYLFNFGEKICMDKYVSPPKTKT